MYKVNGNNEKNRKERKYRKKEEVQKMWGQWWLLKERGILEQNKAGWMEKNVG